MAIAVISMKFASASQLHYISLPTGQCWAKGAWLYFYLYSFPQRAWQDLLSGVASILGLFVRSRCCVLWQRAPEG